MPSRRDPNTDRGRLAFLRSAINAAQQDLGDGKALIPRSLLDDMVAFFGPYDTAYQALGASLGQRRREVEEGDGAIEEVRQLLSHMWTALLHRAEREKLNVGVLSYYRLTGDGTRPEPTTRGEWLRLAEEVVRGDAEAVADGYRALQEPSAADLQAALVRASAEVGEIGRAERDHDNAQALVGSYRAGADALIASVVAALTYATYTLEPASQRRVLRRYGVLYRLLPGETPDDEEKESEELV